MFTAFLNIAIVIAILAVLYVLFQKRMRTSKKWAATVTPLASIIGSGFLVVGPLLYFHFGLYSPLAMLALCLFAYCIGSVIRGNILAEGAQPTTGLLKSLSHIGLFAAYIVSVAFYIELLASFLVEGAGHYIPDWSFIKPLVATTILLFVGGKSYFNQLKGLEKMEEVAVNGKLAIIAGLIVGLCGFNFEHFSLWQGVKEPSIGWNAVRILMGSIIVVQGFETSRFLVGSYPPKTLVSTMRNSQIISSIIYLVFVSLMLVVFTEDIQVSDTAIIDLSRKVSGLLPPILIFAAILSQLSAATADTIGAGGLLRGFGTNISARFIYLPVIVGAISLVWLTDVFQIVAIASRCFAIYYAVECFTAAKRAVRSSKLQTASYLFLAAMLVACAIFGLAAEG